MITEKNYINNSKQELVSYIKDNAYIDVPLHEIDVIDPSMAQVAWYNKDLDAWYYCEADHGLSEYEDGTIEMMYGKAHASFAYYRCDHGSIKDYTKEQHLKALRPYYDTSKGVNNVKIELGDSYSQIVIECMFEQDLL